MEFSWSHNAKCKEVPQSSISTHPFSDVPSFSKISRLSVRTNKIVSGAVYHPYLSRLTSKIHPFIFFETS